MIEFEWKRCSDGYRRQDRRPLSAKTLRKIEKYRMVNVDPYAGSQDIWANSDQYEPTRPLNVVLFKVFADWEATPDGMVEFCNAYGQLRIGPGGQGIEPVAWMLEHQALIRQFVRRVEASDASGLIEGLKRGWGGNCSLRLRRRENGSLAPILVPDTLLSAMWMQLALHAASQAKLLTCHQCGKPFEVGTGTGRRETAMYCSNACKVAAFKASKRRTSKREELSGSRR
jgi:hypothetical protein